MQSSVTGKVDFFEATDDTWIETIQRKSWYLISSCCWNM